MNIYYVYIYHNNEGIPYYVGKGKDNRITEHLSAARRNRKYPLADKIRSLWKNNKQPLYQKVATNLSENCAYELEEYLISFYKRKLDGGTLLNLSTGGERPTSGVVPHNKGIACTDEAKANISAKLKLYYTQHDSPRKGASGLSFWSNPKSDKFAWSNLDIFYKYFLLGIGKRTFSKVFQDLSPTVFSSVIKYFKTNGDPSIDLEWLKYRDSVGLHQIVENPYQVRPNCTFSQGLKEAESIQDLVKQGKGSILISKQLNIPIGAVYKIVRDTKNGWVANEDKFYLFAKARAQEIQLNIGIINGN